MAGWWQSFTYDGLNRLLTGVRSDGGYNQAYHYDSFGNMRLEDHVTANPFWTNGTVDANNRLQAPGVSYDAAGHMVTTPNGTGGGAGGMTYLGYTADGNMATIGSSAGATDIAQYTYDANDLRVAKTTSAGTTNYVYFGGQPVADQLPSGAWEDYIYAGGQKVAKIPSAEGLLQLTVSTGGNWQWYDLGVAHGVVIAPGDKLAWRQYGTGGAHGGMEVRTAAGGNSSWYLQDQNGDYADSGTPTGVWESRFVDLTPLAGSGISQLSAGLDTTTSGAGVLDFADIALVHADGSVTPVFNGTAQGTLGPPRNTWPPVANVFTAGYITGTAGTAAQQSAAVHYYLDDHLGTTQVELAGGGWPLWQGQFTPFGAEIVNGSETYLLGTQPADGTNMRFKFTGKERDTESGLDYFGARYYASTMARWIEPDWSQKPEPVPYSVLDDPQSFNLYQFVRNSPLSNRDSDGHDCPPDCSTGNQVGDFVLGVANAWNSDNLMGIGRFNIPTAGGQYGQALGDGLALAQSGGEFILGLGGNIGGFVLDATGVGAVIGVPANVVSTTVMVHGTAVGMTAVTHMFSKRSGDFTKAEKKQMDAKNAAENGGANKCTDCGQEVQKVQNKPGEPRPGNQLQRHHDPPLSKRPRGTKSGKDRILCADCHVQVHKNS